MDKLIEKGLNPRFKWCGISSANQLKEKLLDFLPYAIIEVEKSSDELFKVKIEFYNVKLNLKFITKYKHNLYYIQEITY